MWRPFRFAWSGLAGRDGAARGPVFARLGPALVGLALGLLALWPALGPGFALRYDMVFVPEQPVRLPEGFPRAVPSDQVVALLSAVVPAEIVQKAILLGLFVLAASGAGALVGDALSPRAAHGDAGTNASGPRGAKADAATPLGAGDAGPGSADARGPWGMLRAGGRSARGPRGAGARAGTPSGAVGTGPGEANASGPGGTPLVGGGGARGPRGAGARRADGAGARALALTGAEPGGAGVLVARLAAAAFYAWNAYLAQRLLIGQWALLLGYAGLPWAVRAAARGGAVRLAVALLPAAVGGFQAMLVSALTVLPVAALRGLPRRPGPESRGRATTVAGAGAGRGAHAGSRRGARARTVLSRGRQGVCRAWRRLRRFPGLRRHLGELHRRHVRSPGASPALSSVSSPGPSSVLSSVATPLAVVVVLSLPWLVPALVSTADAVADPAGVTAFAPRADGPFGTLGSLLTLGGIWNSHAAVPGQDMPALAAARLALTLVAIAGFVRLGSARLGSVRRPAWWRGLAVAACAGLLIACAGAFAPGVPRALIGWWAGFGPLRDGQAYVAPLALAQAMGVAVAVTALRAAMPAPVAVAALAVPVLVLPTFALGAFGRLGTAEYPEEWRRVQAVVNGDPAPGALLSLPWSAYRAFSWNGGRVVLDPATKMFSRPVVWNDALVVGAGGGRLIRVAEESPRARRVGALLAGPATAPLTGALRREGVRYVLAAGVDENTFLSRLPGATPVYRGAELLLVRV